jgi:hypothetical protein
MPSPKATFHHEDEVEVLPFSFVNTSISCLKAKKVSTLS